ncbi:MAG: glutamate racemase [Candidatus Marinimicrobia bacterium]|nr:glutamate racemase [Candidatus Neomarinimicrobiota bacterium]|tara:strand:+ start:11953 stop:12747 length:795 start_codon:yes stop_codon:yes gene_type:complete
MSANLKNEGPIGVFDSGLGGLTVLKYLLKSLPGEDYIYLGDLINLPYGNKSTSSIVEYSLRCVNFLKSKNVKCIIVACNTASSVAISKIKKSTKIPVFDVISPCVENIIKTENKSVAIIGTEKTIQSNVYSKLIKLYNKKITIYNQACPLFVPIIEEGLKNSDISKGIIDYYLKEIKAKNVDQLVLGCTHYPVIIDDLRKYFNNNIDILHSGPFVVKQVLESFSQNHKTKNKIDYYVTDLPDRFQKLGNRFFNKSIKKVNLVSI